MTKDSTKEVSTRRAYISFNMRWSNHAGRTTELNLRSLTFMGANTLAMLHIDSQLRSQLLALGINIDVTQLSPITSLIYLLLAFHSYGSQSMITSQSCLCTC